MRDAISKAIEAMDMARSAVGPFSLVVTKKLTESIEALQALQSGEAVVPEGYVLVPVEPTEAMIDAFMGRAVKYGWELEVDSPRDGYKAMLSAVKEQQ